MLLVPHIRIARRVNDVMRNKFQIKLSRAVFAFGSIYPDLVKRNRTGYHDCKEALSTVYEYLREKPQSRWAESFRLGMICHYLTDSFCEVHIRHEDYTLRQHLRYEREQSRQIKAYLEHAAQAALQAEYPARYAALDSFWKPTRPLPGKSGILPRSAKPQWPTASWCFTGWLLRAKWKNTGPAVCRSAACPLHAGGGCGARRRMFKFSFSLFSSLTIHRKGPSVPSAGGFFRVKSRLCAGAWPPLPAKPPCGFGPEAV